MIKIYKAKPFLKWAGGKSQLIEKISQYYPFRNNKYTKYVEPFIGGGAILFDILNNYDLESVYISDINKDLINTYKVIKDDVDNLINQLSTFQNEYIPLETEDRKIYFYKKRKEFNKEKFNTNCDDVLLAALMIFLNKTCFNGLYRVNRKGEFNVPMGRYKKPLICDSENLKNVSNALQHVTIKHEDYRESSAIIDSSTFVYMDPPYRPISSTSTFTSYNAQEFTDKSQIELSKYITYLTKEKKALVLLSNSDPKNNDEDDEFFDDLYRDKHINRVDVKRYINSKADKRGEIKELLISNYEVGHEKKF